MEAGVGTFLPMAIDHAEVKRALRDWQTFSSDDPQHITVRPETSVRDVRQLPIETDPPEHREYRKLVEPLFRRPLDEGYRQDMLDMVDEAVVKAAGADEVEVVRDLALPLQNRSLARLLGVGDDDAEHWIGWGLHVFHDGDGPTKGAALAAYIRDKFAAAGLQGDDFFATLNRAELCGRPLTDAEKYGFANLAFAGGRDTVIQSIAATVGHVARRGELLDWLRADEARLSPIVEEIVRHLSPIGALARRCPHGADVAGFTVPPGGRVAVSYAGANYDPSVFDLPGEFRPDRSPNPHLAFGFGKHHCLGAPQARLVLRCLLVALCQRVARAHVVDAQPNIDEQGSHPREVGFNRLVVRFDAR